MEFSAQQIAEFLNGTVEGDADSVVSNVSKIEEGKQGTLSFLANPKYKEYIYSTNASIVIVNKDFQPEQPIPNTCTLVRVDDAYKSFAKLLELYNKVKYDKSGVDATATIAESASVADDVFIGPNVYIGEHVTIGKGTKVFQNATIADKSRVGAGCLIHANVQVMTDSIIGDHCTIQAGAIIGSDGFGFAPNSEGKYDKVPQIGNVILEDHVDIGAGTTIDRATMGSTVIRKGVKLDNLIQVAHNVEIGENTVIAAQTGIAGSTKIGKNCMIGGQAGIIGHLKIGDGVKIAAQSGVGQDIEDNQIVQGSPAFGIGDYKRSYVGFRNLPKIQRQLNEIEKQLKELKDS